MPSTSELHRSRWPGGDREAITYLNKQGYWYDRRYLWHAPELKHHVTVKELDAMLYLMLEWDWDMLYAGSEAVWPAKKDRLPI